MISDRAATMSRKRLLEVGVPNARLKVRRKVWSSDGFKTSAARGETFGFARRLWSSTRTAATKSTLSPRAVSECT